MSAKLKTKEERKLHMKITYRQEQKSFKNLEAGDVFCLPNSDNVYIKMQEIGDVDDKLLANAVELRIGNWVKIDVYRKVIPVECELVIN